MNDKRKIELLKKEIEQCNQCITALKLENTDLKRNIAELYNQNEGKQEFINKMLQELENTKADHDESIRRLQGYKKKYLNLLDDLTKLKRNFKNNCKSLVGEMKKEIGGK